MENALFHRRFGLVRTIHELGLGAKGAEPQNRMQACQMA
jgi:hypothetical protein